MPKIYLVSSAPEAWSELAQALVGNEDEAVEAVWVRSGREALERAAQDTPDLIVVDEQLPDQSGFDFVRQLLSVNAMVNCAVVSALDEGEFHEVSEGLGIVVRLQSPPTEGDADKVLDALQRLRAMFADLGSS